MGDAYALGYDAYNRGDGDDMNPYDEKDAQHDEWDDGHFQAYYSDSEMEKFTMKEPYLFGIIISIVAFIFFAVMIFKMIGLWAILISPIVTLCALRPAHEGGCFVWERIIEEDNNAP